MNSRWRAALPAVAAAVLTTPLLFDGAGPPLGVLVGAAIGQVALLVGLLPLVRAHLGARAWVSMLGVAAPAASTSALFMAVAVQVLPHPGPLDAGTFCGLLVLLGTSATTCVLAVTTARHACRRGGDPRARRWALLALAALAVTVHAVLSAAGPEPVPAAVTPALLVLLVSAGWAATAVTAACRTGSLSRGREEPWNGDLVVHGISMTAAVVVLALDVHPWGAWSELPELLALLALALVGVKLVLLLRELVVLRAVRRLSRTDPLTGLLDRGAVLAELELLAAQGGPAALLLLDVDGFRRLNDALGHAVGDALLRSVADRLRRTADPGAVVARLGDDEFAVVLTGAATASRQAARAAADTLHAALVRPHEVGGRAVVAPAHIGVVVEACVGGVAPLDLLRRADVAMAWARTLRSEPVEHHSGLDDAVRESVELVGELRRALDGDQVRLHFQPRVDVLTGRVRGTEALVRWAHPERGVLTPDVFLPVAAEAGLMGRLTSVVLEAAIGQAAAWDRAGTPVPVSVNLTATDVRPELVEEVAQLLVREQLPASLLVLEITETVLVVDPAGTAAVLADLVELGVEVSIDDFGTGYSSLEVLLSLPVTELKIDRTFVAGVLRDLGRYTVVRSTIDLAHGLGLRVVAEGVEDNEVLEVLRELGCDVSQGYLHSRPLPALEATAWLTERTRSRPSYLPEFRHESRHEPLQWGAAAGAGAGRPR